MQLTVVICTYKREELLESSLVTLKKQTASPTAFKVLVVDNADLRATREVADRLGYCYTVEPKLGLSHARNRGMECADTEWVLYLDDDIQAPPDLIKKFLDRLTDAPYAALGGQVFHWLRPPVPRWVYRYYTEPMRPSPQHDFGPLTGEQYLMGGLFAVRKSAWSAIGGFSDAVGMHGFTVGRADEDEFQLRLRRYGYEIFYDPDIVIDHLVQPYKYTFSGHLQLAYASGRDGIGMRGNVTLTWWDLLKRCVSISLYSVPFNMARWMFKPGYYWQNALMDSITKYYFAWGQYFSGHNKV